MELYYIIAIVDRSRADAFYRICQEFNLPVALTKLARGTAKSEHLLSQGLETSEKAVIDVFAGPEAKNRMMRAAKREMCIDIPGNGIIMAVPVKSVGGSRALDYLTGGAAPEGGKPEMKFDNELIIAVFNEGYSDLVMDAARSAGATGGTVLHAKGTGRNKSKQFFEVSITHEKDMVYIVAAADKKSAIMRRIAEKAGRDTEAEAVCFSLPVSEVVGLRGFYDEQEENEAQ